MIFILKHRSRELQNVFSFQKRIIGMLVIWLVNGNFINFKKSIHKKSLQLTLYLMAKDLMLSFNIESIILCCFLHYCPPSQFFINIVWNFQPINQEKGKIRYADQKEIKLSLFGLNYLIHVLKNKFSVELIKVNDSMVDQVANLKECIKTPRGTFCNLFIVYTITYIPSSPPLPTSIQPPPFLWLSPYYCLCRQVMSIHI